MHHKRLSGILATYQTLSYILANLLSKIHIQKIRYNERQSVLDNDLLQTKKVANIIHIQELVAIRFILTSPLRIEPSKLVKEIHKYDLSFSCFAEMEFQNPLHLL